MTLEQYIERLKALLTEAEKAGLDMNDVCSTTEYILENGTWDE
jgi:hypothetical protein